MEKFWQKKDNPQSGDDANDREVNEPKHYTDERTFGINDYEDFIKYLGDTKTNWNLKSKGFYDLYAKYGLKMRK